MDGTRQSVELLLGGVHCAACVWLIERLPRLEPAVVEARVDLGRSTLTLTWDEQVAPLSQVARTLLSMGYEAGPFRGKEAERLRQRELRSLLVRIGVAGAVAGNVMLMAFALYSGDVGLDEAGTMDAATTRFFEVLSFVVSLPSLWAGSVFFRGAWAALRTRTPHMDLPIAVGIAAAFAGGTYGALSGRGEIYFDSITTLVFLLLVGRYLQRRHQLAAADAIELVHAVTPSQATVLSASRGGTVCEGEVTRRVASEDLSPGELVVVESGQVAPVDGMVRRGQSSLDKSLLSGESKPISVKPGDFAEAGALNLGSRLVIEVTRAGLQTRVARLMLEVERAMSTRTPLVGQADRVAGVFTVVVIVLAAVVALHWIRVSPSAALENSLALLIVACPCALSMATPLALSAAVRKAAQQKKLVFSAGTLEQLARPTELVVDKTGTLTHGDLRVTEWVGDSSLVSVVAEAEKGLSHPVARALGSFQIAEQPSVRSLLVGAVHEHLGAGIEAETAAGTLLVGSRRFVERSVHLGGAWDKLLLEGRQGDAPVVIALDGTVRAVAWLGDTVRPDAAAALRALKELGHTLHLCSGDDEATVLAVARQLASEAGDPELFSSVLGGATPERKLQTISHLKGRGRPVVMVGDGVNDTGALAAADIGISVKGAAEASRISSDIYLAASGVSELHSLVCGAGRALATIRRGMAFSMAYNAFGIVMAALGLLSPLWAAVLMPLSSITVVTNAYRSRSFVSETRGSTS